MIKSSAFRYRGKSLPVAAAALLLGAFGVINPASALTICPSSGSVGGISETTANVAGPLDGTCGANSAVFISIPASNDYGKLTFNGTPAGYPATTLSNFLGATANVSFTSGGSDGPYYELAFLDGSDSLGQASPSDQILLIEFQPAAYADNTLAMDPATTLFNVYDNTTSQYLEGGQAVTNTLDGWLAADPSLGTQTLAEVRIGMGLTGGNSGPESMTINAVDMTIPEPASLALFGFGAVAIGALRRRRRT